MHLVWFPILVGWLCKRSIIRFGGAAGYRRFMPLFMGLIVGDYLVGGVWCLLSIATGKPMYVFWGG
jgi:hypothetical protein